MANIKALVLFFVVSLLPLSNSMAQCAMCRATLETNVSNGSQEQLASTLNFGILYLFVAPYMLVAVVGFLWFKQSKLAANKEK